MPAHDWTRVDDGIFHDFHLAWIAELSRILNTGLLPPDYYVLAEKAFPLRVPDVGGLDSLQGVDSNEQVDETETREMPKTFDVFTTPPRVWHTALAESFAYGERQHTVVVRDSEVHGVRALIEMVSPGTKNSQHLLRRFLHKALAALRQGIHLLILDLHPPGPRDPQGIHGVLWEELTGDTEYQQPPGLPLTLAAYSAGLVKTAYVEPIAVGAALPELPLFLEPEEYINVPLERTYLAAYEGVPRFYRDLLER